MLFNYVEVSGVALSPLVPQMLCDSFLFYRKIMESNLKKQSVLPYFNGGTIYKPTADLSSTIPILDTEFSMKSGVSRV